MQWLQTNDFVLSSEDGFRPRRVLVAGGGGGEPISETCGGAVSASVSDGSKSSSDESLTAGSCSSSTEAADSWSGEMGGDWGIARCRLVGGDCGGWRYSSVVVLVVVIIRSSEVSVSFRLCSLEEDKLVSMGGVGIGDGGAKGRWIKYWSKSLLPAVAAWL